MPKDSFLPDGIRCFSALLLRRPAAIARIRGSDEYPEIHGEIRFYETLPGVLAAARISGLPTSDNPCEKRIFAFHIHSGGRCSGNPEDAFADAMTHYNPQDCAHPEHAGDLPPLFGCGGYAFQAFLTDRFTVKEIIGKTVIIHLNPDDFTSQPSGNSGKKIACGLIESARRL